MTAIRRILAATDLSPCATLAETRAAMLCAELKNDALGLLNVVDDGAPSAPELLPEGTPRTKATLAEYIEYAERELQRIAQRLQQDHGVRCDRSVGFGRPATGIASRAEVISADLIVVGAHGCNSVSPTFLGNTPYKLLHIGGRPLLIVRNQPERPYLNVLVPVDFSEDSKSAAEIALAVAPGAAVTLLHGFEVINEGLMHYAGISTEFIGGYRNDARKDAVEEMERLLSGLDKGQRLVSTSVQFGYPPSVILEYAETFKPDLIVIGKHGKSRIEDFLLGSVTRHTIEETSCDVLVAPAKRA